MADTTPTPMGQTPCDAHACPASSLVQVTHPSPTATRPGTLTFCGHHYHVHEMLLALAGWRVVADMRTWKAGASA